MVNNDFFSISQAGFLSRFILQALSPCWSPGWCLATGHNSFATPSGLSILPIALSKPWSPPEKTMTPNGWSTGWSLPFSPSWNSFRTCLLGGFPSIGSPRLVQFWAKISHFSLRHSLYLCFQCVFLVWLMSPLDGSSVVYNRIILPLFNKNQSKIDSYLNKGKGMADKTLNEAAKLAAEVGSKKSE